MRILMITQRVDLEDAVLGFTHRWIEALAARVDHIDVLALKIGRVDLPDNVACYPMQTGSGRFNRLRTFYQRVGNLSRNADAIFIHMIPRWAIMAWPYARLRRIPLIMWYAHEKVDAWLRLANRLIDRAVTSTAEGYRIASEKLVVIGQGIDTQLFAPVDSATRSRNEPLIVAVGRISPIKDYATLLHAVQRIQSAHLKIIGEPLSVADKVYQQEIIKLCESLGLSARVEFVGPIANREVVKYYQQADVVVNSRLSGSMDKSVLEAMATARPTVVCNRTFLPILGDLQSALFFNEGDEVALADRLDKLIKVGSIRRAEIGRTLRQRVVEQHGIEQWTANLIQIFSEVVAQSNRDFRT